MIEILNMAGDCSSPALGAVLIIAKRIMGFVHIIVPILLIIMSVVNFIKLMNNPEEKKGLKPIFNSFLAAALVFFVPTFVNATMNLLDGSFNVASCWNSATITPTTTYQGTTTNNSNKKSLYEDPANYENGNPRKKPTPAGTIGSSNADSGVNVTNGENGLYALKYNGWDYLLYIPQNVDSNKPLIIFLHGNYNQGHDLNKLYVDGGYAAHIKNGTQYPAYILMPLLPSGSWTSGSNTKTLMELIEKTVNENGIDRRRISISGFSMGANETPAIVTANPNYFASEVIMSIQWFSPNYIPVIKNVPTRIYYGTADPYAGGCQSLYNTLRNAGGEVEIFSYPGQGHAYLPKRVLDDTNSNVINWILSKSRN